MVRRRKWVERAHRSFLSLAALALAATLAPFGASPALAQFGGGPTVTIESSSLLGVTEGQDAEFQLSISPAASPFGLTVNIELAQSGDYLTSTQDLSVEVRGGATSHSFSVSTENDSADEANGSVTATVGIGLGYAPGNGSLLEPKSATVRVLDNDPAVTLSLNSAGADNTYRTGDMIEITATFGQSVTVAGTPRIPFTLGTETKHATYSSGSPGTALVFSYTVASGDTDTDGIAVAADALELNGGTINLTSDSGTASELDHVALAASASHTVDTTAPEVTISGVPAAINATTAFTATFTFSEAVTGFDATDAAHVALTNATAGTFTESSATTYTLEVTPSSQADVVVTVKANAATDVGGNTGPAADAAKTARWDATAPGVTITGVPAAINSTSNLSVTFTWSEDVTGFAASDVTVTGGTASGFSGSGDSYTLTVTPSGNVNVVVSVGANTGTDGGGNTGPAAAESATAVWDVAPDFGTATVANQSYTLNSAIADLVLPAATGGNGTLTYALSPDPPAGLTFTASTRTLSGTPTARQTATTYTYQVTDADANTAASDADSLTFTIAVSFGCSGSTAVGGSSVTSGGLVDDCEALLASEAALVGTGTALNWDTGTAMASWNGVTVSGGRVTGISLHNSGLAGSIPAELGNLSSLTILNLNGNSLTGSIPSALGDLSSLTQLFLDGNSLTGSIPSALGNLSSLTWLHLRRNSLTGSIPSELGSLSSLIGLNLSNNSLTGSIPSELGNLTSLTGLSLTNNSLTGSIPSELGNLSSLTGLNLNNNSLTGSIPSALGNLSSLTTLSLSNNSLTGAIPSELGNLTSLRWLFLRTNSLTGCIPVALRNFASNINPQKNSVTLSVCAVDMPLLSLTPGDGEINASWNVPAGNTPTGYDLEYKLSSATAWTDAGHTGTGTTATIGSLTNGSPYDARVRAKTATDTGEWSAVATATPKANAVPDFGSATVAAQAYPAGSAITNLVLPAATGGNGTLTYALSPDPPAGLMFDAETRTLSGTPTAVQTATVYTYKVTDSDTDTTATDADSLTFTIAVTVCAGSAAVGGSAVTSGGLVDDCEALLASEAALVGTGTALNWDAGTAMASWDGVTVSGGRVTRVSLNSVNLRGTIPSELGNLSRLLILSLAGNSLTGAIPSELGNLSSLVGLFLRANSLTGAIPLELGDLSRLTFLSLDENSLTGCIPVALGSFAPNINPQKNDVTLSVCAVDMPVLSLTPGDGEINASWNVPAGNTPTGYDLQYKLSSATAWTDAGHTGTGTTATLGSLTNGSPYDVRVRAKTATDTGEWSAVATATPKANAVPDFGSATVAAQAYPAGSAITDLVLPAATGGNGTLTYALSPDPPAGLMFDAETRTLSGTPTAVQIATVYTYKVTDSDTDTTATDADSLTFTIAVTVCAGSAAVGGSAVTSGGLVDDCEALLASEAALVGTGTALNWDAGTAMASWDGVTVSGGRVTGVVLDSVNLRGTIPSELGDLSRLRRLDLGNNSLTGTIPSALGDLSSLGLLYLTGNSLTGAIPSELGDLSRLTHLHIDNNSLTGAIPSELGNLDLTSLSLGGNSLTGAIPVKLGNLSRLTSLFLRNNSLTGCIPVALRRFAPRINPQKNSVTLPVCAVDMPVLSLTPGDGEIDASWNVPAGNTPTGYDLEYKLSSDTAWTDAGHTGTGTTATLGSLTNGSPYDARVRAKTATDTGEWSAVATATPKANAAPDFGSATVAAQAYPVGSAITDLVLPAATGGNGTLTYALSPDPPAGLMFDAGTRTLSGTPTAVQTATVYTYKVTDSDTDTTATDADSLTFTIAVTECAGSAAVGGSDGDERRALVDDCKALLASKAALVGTGTALNWSHGTAMASWDGVTVSGGRVTRVVLNSVNLRGTIPSKLGDLSSLTYLSLGDNSLTGTIPSKLGDLSSLTYLYLSDNSLTGTIPSELGNLSSLTSLSLSDNSLTGAIPSELGDLSRLTHLLLADNLLTGAIPVELGDLSSLTHLSLGNNSLTGTIPSKLGDLSSLTYLYLSRNSLTGTIPSKLGDLSNLTHLLLGNNLLTGAIPVELGDLSSLTHLYLRNNSLTGAIPVELGDLSRLVELNLGGNSLTGAIPVELGDLSRLTYLILRTNSLTGCIPVALRRFASNINPQKNSVTLPVCAVDMPVLSLTPGDGEIDASWNVPAGNTPTGYDLEYKLSSDTAWTDAGHTGTGTTATIGSLTNGSPYDARVRAKTATDTGEWSAVATATPEGTPTVTLVLSPVSIKEASETASETVSTVTATLSHASSAAVTLTVSASPGTDTVAGDYTLSATTTLTIAAGSTSSTGTVTLTAVDNDVDAPDKTVTVSATVSGDSGVADPANQDLTITDDEGTPTVTLVLGPVSIKEASETASETVSTVTATLSGPSSEAVTLTVAASPGTDTVAGDYTLAGTTLTIAAGSTSSTGTVTVTAVDNEVDAPDKTVTVSATAAGGGVSNPADVTLTITDDETTPTATLVLSPSTIDESGAANASTVTATLSHASSAAVTLTVAASPGTDTVAGDFTLARHHPDHRRGGHDQHRHRHPHRRGQQRGRPRQDRHGLGHGLRRQRGGGPGQSGPHHHRRRGHAHGHPGADPRDDQGAQHHRFRDGVHGHRHPLRHLQRGRVAHGVGQPRHRHRGRGLHPGRHHPHHRCGGHVQHRHRHPHRGGQQCRRPRQDRHGVGDGSGRWGGGPVQPDPDHHRRRGDAHGHPGAVARDDQGTQHHRERDGVHGHRHPLRPLQRSRDPDGGGQSRHRHRGRRLHPGRHHPHHRCGGHDQHRHRHPHRGGQRCRRPRQDRHRLGDRRRRQRGVGPGEPDADHHRRRGDAHGHPGAESVDDQGGQHHRFRDGVHGDRDALRPLQRDRVAHGVGQSRHRHRGRRFHAGRHHPHHRRRHHRQHRRRHDHRRGQHRGRPRQDRHGLGHGLRHQRGGEPDRRAPHHHRRRDDAHGDAGAESIDD